LVAQPPDFEVAHFAMDLARPPTLQFEIVGGGIPVDYSWRFRCLEFNAVHQKLIACDGWSVIAIDPLDGSHRILRQFPNESFISCIDPSNGDVVMATNREGSAGADFSRVAVTTGQTSTISLADVDLWSYAPQRLIILGNGERCILATELDPDGMMGSTEAGHFDANGKCIAWSVACFAESFQSPANRSGVFDSFGHSVTAYFFEQRAAVFLAGSEDTPGCVDGVGTHARFGDLRLPTVNNKFLFVRMDGAETWQWRLARLNLKTLQVQSVHVTGLDHSDLLNYCASDDYMFALKACPASKDEVYKLLLMRASLDESDPSPGLVEAVSSVDLRAPVQAVSFRLSDGTVLQVDRRILVARSEYFRRMLSSGLREEHTNEIDLCADSDADEASLSVLLRFVLSDAWEGPHKDVELAFRVRCLADLRTI